MPLVTPSTTIQLRPFSNPNPNVVEINGKKYQITTLKLRNSGMGDWRSVDLTTHPQVGDIAQKCASLFENIHNPQDGSPSTIKLSFELESVGVVKPKPFAIVHLKKIETSSHDSSQVQTREFDLTTYAPAHQEELKEKLDLLRETLKDIFLLFPQEAPQLYSRPVPPTPISTPTPSYSRPAVQTVTFDGLDYEYQVSQERIIESYNGNDPGN